MSFISNDINRAEKALRNHELVAIATETVYGLAGNGFDNDDIKQIFKVKNRPYYDPLILHSNSIQKFENWGLKIPDQLLPLAKRYWPGPLTLLVDKGENIPDLVTAGLSRVAIRIPNHALTLQLLAKLDFPLAAPSANPFGYVSPTKPEHVAKHFEFKIAMVLDGGQCQVGIESTIVGLENEEPVIYRLGGLSIEQIEEIIGNVQIKTSSSKPAAPGMLVKHYAPNKKIVVIDNEQELTSNKAKDCAYILFNFKLDAPSNRLIILSESGDYNEAAQRFYDALRSWDNNGEVKKIIIERLPDFGLGRAINDRLLRAAAD